MEDRPLSPHIQIYKWHISSLVSISHRITGIINIIAITLVCLLASLLFLGGSIYEVIDFFLERPEMICCPIDENNITPGHPVIFPGKYIHSLTEITGDIGAREVLKKDKQSINYFATKRKSYFLDLDTPEEWSSWTNLNKK